MMPELKRHTLIGNKLLMLFSGLSRKKEKNGKVFYEKHHIGLAKEYIAIGKWSATMVKQMIAYIAMCDSTGFVPYISEEELANLINCSLRTIQTNNQKFDKYGILKWDRAFKGHISISICNYAQNVLDLHKGERDGIIVKPIENNSDDIYAYLGEDDKSFYSKSGYTSICVEILHKLFEIKDVNIIRLICRVLYTYEIDVNLHHNESTSISLEDIKYVLPRYIGYKKAIKELINKVKNIFNINIYDTGEKIQEFISIFKPMKSNLKKVRDNFVSVFALPQEFDSKKKKANEYLSASIELSTFTKKWNLFVNPEQKDLLAKKDLHSLTVTFGLEALRKSFQVIDEMISNYQLYSKSIQDLEEDFARKFYAIVKNYACQ